MLQLIAQYAQHQQLLTISFTSLTLSDHKNCCSSLSLSVNVATMSDCHSTNTTQNEMETESVEMKEC